MTSSSPSRHDTLLRIKAAPPRPRRWWLQRGRLLARFANLRERPLLAVQAPAGFGKTSLLASLRREWLASGAYVSWLTLDERDDPSRFVEGLLLSLTTALGNPPALAALRRELSIGADPHEIVGRLLALLADQAHPVVMIFDDLHALPEVVTTEMLPYIVLNMPANVHTLVGSRHALPSDARDLLQRGDLALLDQDDLRFRVEESLELLRARFGNDIDADTAARVHDAVGGWPLGVQLAISVAERSDAPVAMLTSLGAHGVDLRLHAADAMLGSLEPTMQEFLVTLVPLDRLHPDLCVLMTGRDDAPAVLSRLNNETPVLHAAEGQDWYRMHAVCRHALRQRFDALPAGRRKTLHWRAAQWLHDRQLLDEAAEHALAAERSAIAYEWIAQGLHDMVLGTRFAAALGWLERLPHEALTRYPALGLAAAIANTLTYQHEAAAAQLAALDKVELTVAQRFELLQARGALAHYRDDYTTIAEVAANVGEVPEHTDTAMRAAHIDMLVCLALHRGNTAAARYELRMHHWPARNQPLDYGQCYAQFFRAYTDWLDGCVSAAEGHLAPHQLAVESRFGRRSVPASLLASLYAAVLWDSGRSDDAEAMLADRLDIVERTSSPIAVALAYRTLIRAARQRGARARADELIGNLSELGQRRGLPRLVIVALIEQLRIEVATPANQTYVTTLERLRRYRRESEFVERYDLTARLDLVVAMADARVALCLRDDVAAAESLADLQRIMGPVWPTRDRMEAQVLEAMLAASRGEAYAEALATLAATAADLGWHRLLADSSVEPAALAGATQQPVPRLLPRTTATAAPQRPAPVVRSVLLTDKEGDVLSLLARNYTNKEIARALDIGGETAKWHVKNIASKLSAGGRRHIVERARLLGLLTADSILPG
ncbi:MAG: AAA family ATPase [Rhodocyclaceae bacterium]|nr:AAA family ATPase [Rhodocyclaceae bacterium]